MNKIDGEQAYPIYLFSAKWYQDGLSEFDSWKEGLPKGKIWNGTSFRKMYKQEKKQTELNKEIIDWWSKYKRKRLKGTKASHPILSVRFGEYEVWCLEWFQHWTFDIGQSDEEALKSFRNFVIRKEMAIEKEGKEEGLNCLMGAQDEWRWCGTIDGTPATKTEPPCRCKYCKKQGVIRIGH